jgi:transposase-like protein
MLSVEQRIEYVRAYRESGLNQAAFAKREGLRYSTFCHWVQKVARGELRAPSTPATRAPQVQFAQVQLPAAATASAPKESAGIEVQLADGVVVRGDDVSKLAALVRALRS